MVIWVGLWHWLFLMPQTDAPMYQSFFCFGTIPSGFAIGIIGLLFGQVSRGAKAADNTVGVASTGPTIPMVVNPAVPVVANGVLASSDGVNSTNRVLSE